MNKFLNNIYIVEGKEGGREERTTDRNEGRTERTSNNIIAGIGRILSY